MSRTLLASHRTSLETPHGETQPLVFIELTHADLATPIRVVSDTATENGVPVTWTLDGNAYTAFPFTVRLLTDDDGPPRGELEVANVDRAIGEALLPLSTPLSLHLRVIPASEFDVTVNPRVPYTTPPTYPYEATNLVVREITVDALTIRGTIESVDDTAELWPGLTVTKALLPGMFR